jgi:predicted ArsR family transcriptional regulator
MANRNPEKEQSLTEQVVDLLATMESAKSRELADQLGLTNIQVRNELLDLEKLGIVYRTGRTRGTRWWLG